MPVLGTFSAERSSGLKPNFRPTRSKFLLAVEAAAISRAKVTCRAHPFRFLPFAFSSPKTHFRTWSLTAFSRSSLMVSR